MPLNVPAASREAREELLNKKLAAAKEEGEQETAPFDVEDKGEVAAETTTAESIETTSDQPLVEAPDRPALAASKPMTVATVEDDEDGFGDLDGDLGFGSFPMIKLENSGKFAVSSLDGVELDHFDAQLLQSRQKALIKARQAPPEEEVPLVYAYLPEGADIRTVDILSLVAIDGTLVADHVKKWKADEEMEADAHPVVAGYREVIAKIFSTGTELDNEVAILNIPPASKSRLAGYYKALQLKKMKLSKVLTRVKRGPKIVKGKKTFYPWDFALVGRIEE